MTENNKTHPIVAVLGASNSSRNYRQGVLNSALDVPRGWIQLTRPDLIEELEFAIKQLEKKEKPYFITKHRDKKVTIWVKQK